MIRSPTTTEAVLCGLAVVAIASVAAYLTSGHAAWGKTGRKHEVKSPQVTTYVVLRPERLPTEKANLAAPSARSSQPAAVGQALRLPKLEVAQASLPAKPKSPVATVAAPKPKLLLPVADAPIKPNGRLSEPSLPSKSLGRAHSPLSAAALAKAESAPKSVIASKEKARTAQRAVPTTPLYTEARREVGRSLLGSDGKQGGLIPPITMDYQRTLGWDRYVQAMQRLGGQFVIFDRRTDKVRGIADLHKLDVTPTTDAALRGLSPRLREIEQESAIAPVMTRAVAKFGAGDYALVLLLPLNVDFDIVGGIAKRLADGGTDIKTVARVLGEYEPTADGLRLHARQLVLRDGGTRGVDFTIEL